MTEDEAREYVAPVFAAFDFPDNPYVRESIIEAMTYGPKYDRTIRERMSDVRMALGWADGMDQARAWYRDVHAHFIPRWWARHGLPMTD